VVTGLVEAKKAAWATSMPGHLAGGMAVAFGDQLFFGTPSADAR
jgi:hypothetical protein